MKYSKMTSIFQKIILVKIMSLIHQSAEFNLIICLVICSSVMNPLFIPINKGLITEAHVTCTYIHATNQWHVAYAYSHLCGVINKSNEEIEVQNSFMKPCMQQANNKCTLRTTCVYVLCLHVLKRLTR